MASLEDIGVPARINSLSVLVFLLAYSILRLQPINDRIYFPKWYLKGIRARPVSSGSVRKVVNLDPRMYLRFWNWMPAALQMPEPELIDHAGLDSAVYIFKFTFLGGTRRTSDIHFIAVSVFYFPQVIYEEMIHLKVTANIFLHKFYILVTIISCEVLIKELVLVCCERFAAQQKQRK